MPSRPPTRRRRPLYQPPLPWSADPCPTTRRPRPAAVVAGAEWRLDERTRRAGRLGVAAARAALAAAGTPADDSRATAA